jgi:hypothetical protein
VTHDDADIRGAIERAQLSMPTAEHWDDLVVRAVASTDLGDLGYGPDPDDVLVGGEHPPVWWGTDAPTTADDLDPSTAGEHVETAQITGGAPGVFDEHDDDHHRHDHNDDPHHDHHAWHDDDHDWRP